MKKKTILLGFTALWCGLSMLSAQVTIGADNAPQSFSVLELISGNNKGMRLPQLTQLQRDTLDGTTASTGGSASMIASAAAFATGKTNTAMGLTIFNTTTKCVETWNGAQWIEKCATCGGVPCVPPAAPLAAAHTLCSGATVADLTATAEPAHTLKWYNVASGGTPLASGTALAGGNYYVSQTNSYGYESDRTTVSVVLIGAPAQPSAITGSTAVWAGDADLIYFVTNEMGITYNWTLPSDWLKTAGGTTNSITVTAGAASGTITVTPNNGCDGTAQTLAVTVNSTAPPFDIDAVSAGSGTLAGRICFDVAKTNTGREAGPIAYRQAQTPYSTHSRADFTLNVTKEQVYTFRPTATVSKLQFYAVGTMPDASKVITRIIPANSAWATATNLTVTDYTATYTYNTNLNTAADGKTRSNAITVDIYAVYNMNANGSGGDAALRKVKLTASVQDGNCCGAKTTPSGDFVAFMCHNLGADPNKSIAQQMDHPSPTGNGVTDATVYGDLYQWGRVADGHQMRNSSDANGGSGATTIVYDGNSQIPTSHNWYGKHVYFGGSPYDWHGNSSTNKNDNLWNFTTYPGNNPCPAGWRVPTQAEWGSIFRGGTTSGAPSTSSSGNTWTWNSSGTTGYEISTDGGSTTSLFLPAAGCRYNYSATLDNAGMNGYYWSTTTVSSVNVYSMYFSSSNVYPGSSSYYRAHGFSVRCVAE
jgi:uncharacterized protein (TIGR02145 family)